MAARRDRASRILASLRRLYPGARCALHHRSALELIVATILSAQCTDERVNRLTPALFRKYRDATAWAATPLETLQEEIRPTGFFKNKAKAIIGLGRMLVERHAGEVPDSMDALVALPGVGRKTANVVLGTWFRRPAIAVDTHVSRLAARLELSRETHPDKIEADLMALLDPEDWTFASLSLIEHGRAVCTARRPDCLRCPLREDCPSSTSAPASRGGG